MHTLLSEYKNAILYLVLLSCTFGCNFSAQAQGINYPGNVPSNNGGAGNARTDADNFFTRNNPAAMTEIESSDIPSKKSNWRVMFEAQGAFYRYERRFTPFGFNRTVQSDAKIALPTLSGEVTYTATSKRYAFGVGLLQTFGFESKLKDSETVLGSQAQFYDTKVASNDVAFGGAFRVHKKLSIGGSLIVGRAFLLQIAPVPQLAAIGIIKQNRLDVSRIGGVGASFNIHFRRSEKVNFGFNYKTARKYDLQGTLDTVLTLVTPTGLQFAPIQLGVKVPFKFPSIIESGVNIKPNERFFVDFDYRFYRYSKALDSVNVLDKQSGTNLAAQNLNAKDVHLFLVGGAYNLTEKSKILCGAGLTTNPLNDVSFNPGLNNSGGISVSGGYARRISGAWFNFGATGIFALNRTINVAPQVFFPGDYKSRGIIFGIGIRR